MKSFKIAHALPLTAAYTDERGSTVLLPSTCLHHIRNTLNGTETVSVSGRIRSVKAINGILTSKRVEQQSYRSCMGLMRLADKYSVDRLEAACRKALTFTASPSYKSIKNILDTENDKTPTFDAAGSKSISTPNKHALTRGSDYYRR